VGSAWRPLSLVSTKSSLSVSPAETVPPMTWTHWKKITYHWIIPDLLLFTIISNILNLIHTFCFIPYYILLPSSHLIYETVFQTTRHAYCQ
jgi:hypothetical protein